MNFLNFSSTQKTLDGEKPTIVAVVADQVLDSAIVGGIAALSLGMSGASDYTAALYAFGFAFLIKMKEYRKL